MSRWHPNKAYWVKTRTLHDKLVDRASPLLPDEEPPSYTPTGRYAGGLVRWTANDHEHLLYVHRRPELPGYHRIGQLIMPFASLSQTAATSLLISYESTLFSARIAEVTIAQTTRYHSEEEMAAATAGRGPISEMRRMMENIHPHELLMANMLLAEEMTRPPEPA